MNISSMPFPYFIYSISNILLYPSKLARKTDVVYIDS